jgi:integrase
MSLQTLQKSRKPDRGGLTGKGPRRTTDTFKQYVGGFSGWKKIADAMLHNDPETYAIFLGLFKFGCRAMELPTLRKRQIDFDFDDESIMVRGMYVEKQKETIFLVDEKGEPLYKNGKRMFRFEGKAGFRSFPIRKDEHFTYELKQYVDRFKDDESILFPYTYNQMYYKICKIGMVIPPGVRATRWNEFKGPWWLHRIRSERACQLIKNLHYDTFSLQKWFGWSSSQMPETYATISPLDLLVKGKVDWG